jgi:uncharacterized protein (UPF0332 family)
MSPRSAEFLEAANRRLMLARGALAEDPAGAISAAYYSMLYAARAALSEQDVYARRTPPPGTSFAGCSSSQA